MTIWFVVVAIIILVGIATVVIRRNANPQISRSTNTVHVVLIGASIGQGWHLAEWPTRAKASGFTAESIPAWQFDKTEAVEEVLMRPARKFRLTRSYIRSLLEPPPRKANVVILKECSSYFPGDLALYKRNIEKWVSQLQANHSTVILATVVPVTRTRAQQSPDKQECLVEYNGWVREYAKQHGIAVLDLESALRTDESGRYLRDEFAISDGSHLNATAYAVLDDILHKTLCGTSVTEGNRQPVLAVAP
jgi:hypothetical protein